MDIRLLDEMFIIHIFYLRNATIIGIFFWFFIICQELWLMKFHIFL